MDETLRPLAVLTPLHRLPAVARHQRAQDALADAAVGNAQILGWPDLDDRLQDRAAGDDQVGALVANAGQARALFIIHAGDHRADLLHRFDRHVQPVDRAPIVGRQSEVDAGERGHRAAGAEQADALAVLRAASSAKLAKARRARSRMRL